MPATRKKDGLRDRVASSCGGVRAVGEPVSTVKKELEDAMALRQKQQAEHDDLAAVWLLSFPACMIGARWLRSRAHGDSLAALLPGGRCGGCS